MPHVFILRNTNLSFLKIQTVMWLDLVGQTIMVHYQQAWNIRIVKTNLKYFSRLTKVGKKARYEVSLVMWRQFNNVFNFI